MKSSLQIKLIASLLIQLLCFTASAWAGATAVPDETVRLALKQTIRDASSFKDRYDAEVWLVDMSRRLKKYIPNEEERLFILRTVHHEATRHRLNPQLVLAVIHVESLFDRFAISRVGAQGLMQVMPFWKQEIGTGQDNLTDIVTNIRYGCAILRTYLTMEHGHYARALARYNGSVGKTWYAERVMDRWQRFWHVKS